MALARWNGDAWVYPANGDRPIDFTPEAYYDPSWRQGHRAVAKARAHPDQLGFAFTAPVPATGAAALAGLEQRISRCVGAMLNSDSRPRELLAAEMSILLDEEVSRAMLDAYSSPARDQHKVPMSRFLALVAVTQRHDLLDPLMREIGAALLIGEEVKTARLGQIERAMAMLEEERRKFRPPRRLSEGIDSCDATGTHPPETAATLADQAEPREWFTAAELAQLQLPGVPHDKRAMNRHARASRWLIQHDKMGNPLARPREGAAAAWNSMCRCCPAQRGSSWVARSAKPCWSQPRIRWRASWRWYDLQSGAVKAEAEARARSSPSSIRCFNLACHARWRSQLWRMSTARAPRRSGTGSLVEGVAPHHRLLALAPQRKGGGRGRYRRRLWRIFLSDYLRLEAPTMTSCYDRTAAIAKERAADAVRTRRAARPSARSIRACCCSDATAARPSVARFGPAPHRGPPARNGSRQHRRP
jgi:hypothetical protein